MPARDLHFLVVEDHEFQRAALVNLLHTLGARSVHSAEDGRAALQVLRDPDRPIDIVVSDLMMPGMDGMEFIRHIGESGAGVSLILASAVEPDLLSAVVNVTRAYNVSLVGVIEKPPSALKLTPLIEQHRLRKSKDPGVEVPYSRDDIAQAWAQGEFEPWFEPQVDLQTGKVRSMSAAARWRHPTQGLLEPRLFMPSLAARGLSDDFAWWMLQKSMAECRGWHEAGLELAVSVNLDFESLTDVEFAPRVGQLAAQESLGPQHVVLSISERALRTDQARSLGNLARLRINGFKLSLDDFGSGNMAVEQLAGVAFTHLRIRDEFIRSTHLSEAARAGLAVSLDLAQRMKLTAIADGVHSQEQWALLREWGCDLAQGPFVSPALPAEAVLSWVRERCTSNLR